MKNAQEKYQVEAGEALSAAEAPWYVVRTKFHQERRAYLNLRACGFETYLPMRMGRSNGRGVQQSHPLFMRHLFIRVPYILSAWHEVMRTDGVEALIVSAGSPCRVRSQDITRIKAAEVDGLILIKPKERKGDPACAFKRGDALKVRFPERFGPAGLKGGGEIDAVFEDMVDTNRIAILFRLLERDVRVVIPLEAKAAV